MNFPYEDIVHLPHHVSKKHKPMSRLNRAAQFAPFAALTGYDDEVKEAARLTDVQMNISDEIKAELNRKLQHISEHSADKPSVTITYFVPDKKKSGGEYVTVKGRVKRVDEYGRSVVMTDKSVIPIDMIIEITGDMFKIYSES